MIICPIIMVWSLLYENSERFDVISLSVSCSESRLKKLTKFQNSSITDHCARCVFVLVLLSAT